MPRVPGILCETSTSHDVLVRRSTRELPVTLFYPDFLGQLLHVPLTYCPQTLNSLWFRRCMSDTLRSHFGSEIPQQRLRLRSALRSLKTNTISTTYPRTGYHQHYPRPIPGLDNYPSRIGKKLNIPTLVAELPYALRLSTFLGDLSQEPWKHSQAVYLSQATVTVEYALSQEDFTKELNNIRAEYIKQARARKLRVTPDEDDPNNPTL